MELTNNLRRGVIKGINPYEKRNETEEQKKDLVNRFLDEYAVPSDEWTDSTSYYYKHVVEVYFDTYISNDDFIEIASQRFERKKDHKNSPNFVFKFKLIDNKENNTNRKPIEGNREVISIPGRNTPSYGIGLLN